MKTAASYIKKKYDWDEGYSEKLIRDVCHIWCEVIEEAQNDVKKEYEELTAKLNGMEHITETAYWAGRLIGYDQAWEVAAEIVEAIKYTQNQTLNNNKNERNNKRN